MHKIVFKQLQNPRENPANKTFEQNVKSTELLRRHFVILCFVCRFKPFENKPTIDLVHRLRAVSIKLFIALVLPCERNAAKKMHLMLST